MYMSGALRATLAREGGAPIILSPNSSSSSSRGRRRNTGTTTGGSRRRGTGSTGAARGRPAGSPAARAVAEAHRRQAAIRDSLRSAADQYGNVESEDDAADSASPIIDQFVEDNGLAAYRAMTPFNRAEYDRLWGIVGPAVFSEFMKGKGPKCKNTPKDIFFIMLNVLHLPTKWDKHGIDFGMKGPTIEKQVWKMMKIAAPILKAHFQKKMTMGELRDRGQTFKNFPYAHHATDVFFTHSNRPSGTFEESRPYFSGKHHLYGLKVECSVMPNGQACNWTAHFRGGMHDKTICETNIKFHKRSTKKTAAERAIVDHGELADQHPNNWAILEDLAYIGIDDEIRAITPKKKKPRRNLPRLDYERNVKHAGDRVIVENFFGRACMITGIVAKKYTWSRERFNLVIDIVFALTNYHIMLHPLRVQDGEYYNQVLAELKRKGEEAKGNGARRQREYRLRQASVRAALEGVDDEELSDGGSFGGDDGAFFGGGGFGGDDDGVEEEEEHLHGGEEEEEEVEASSGNGGDDDDDDDDSSDDDDDDGKYAESVAVGDMILQQEDEDDSSDDDGNDTGADANTDQEGETSAAVAAPVRKSVRKRKMAKRGD